MPHNNELIPDTHTECISKLSIDAEQWAILEPLVQSASSSDKILNQLLTVETESSAIFALGKV